jgi:predicted amidohydrolase YtcJ
MRYFSLTLLSSCVLVACGETAPHVDPVIANASCYSGGTILTGSGTAEAVVVQNTRIAYVGAAEAGWCPEGAQKTDLAGAVMMPGLVDAHAHLIGIGLREMTLNLEGTESITDLQARIKTAASEMDQDGTLYGRGWIETHWPEERFPTRADLDAVVSDRSVLIERADGHAMVANSFALKLAGITTETESPEGGAINLDTSGEPTGMLVDNAMALVSDLMPGLEQDTKREAYKIGAQLYAARGWTGIHNMSVDPDDVAMLEAMDAAGELPIRIYNSLDTRDLARVQDASPDDKVVTRAIKLYGDGALGSRGAALLKPYADDPGNEGLLTLSDEIMVVLDDAAERGIQVNTHAIGDKANRKVLNWYEESMPDGARWRVEHTQIVNPADIPRYAALGVIPSMQPSHAIGDLHFAPDRLGKFRLTGAYAWRSLIDSGARIAAGSDAPVEVGDPRIEFHAATQRTDLKGFSNEDWRREERVSAEEALKMFTLWPAYAAFQEEELGTIEVGKLADFSVFSGSLTEGEAMAAVPVMTVVNGEVVWER